MDIDEKAEKKKKRKEEKEIRKRWFGACIHWPATSSDRSAFLKTRESIQRRQGLN